MKYNLQINGCVQPSAKMRLSIIALSTSSSSINEFFFKHLIAKYILYSISSARNTYNSEPSKVNEIIE